MNQTIRALEGNRFTPINILDPCHKCFYSRFVSDYRRDWLIAAYSAYLHLKPRSKTVIVSVFALKLKASQTVGDRILLQIWRPPTSLSIRYTACLSDRLAIISGYLHLLMVLYYIHVLFIESKLKSIHIISACFLLLQAISACAH